MMHHPVRTLLLSLIIGGVMLIGGFVLVLLSITGELVNPSAGMVIGGLGILVGGVLVILVGLAGYAFRRPSPAELAMKAPNDPGRWHFTRFGLAYILVMVFGYPVLVMLAPEPRWLVFCLVGLGYLVFAISFIVPRFKQVFFYPTAKDQPATRTMPSAENIEAVAPDYFAPLLAVGALGLIALGTVIILTNDDQKAHGQAFGGIVGGGYYSSSVWSRHFGAASCVTAAGGNGRKAFSASRCTPRKRPRSRFVN